METMTFSLKFVPSTNVLYFHGKSLRTNVLTKMSDVISWTDGCVYAGTGACGERSCLMDSSVRVGFVHMSRLSLQLATQHCKDHCLVRHLRERCLCSFATDGAG
jgi:hypothetical protein